MRFAAMCIAVLTLLVGCSKPGGTGSISGTLTFDPPPAVVQARSMFPNPPIVAGEVLIGFHGDTSDAFAPPTTVRAGGVTLSLRGHRNALGTYVYTGPGLSEAETWSVVAELEGSGVYATVMANIVLETLGAPIAPEDLWHYDLIHLLDAWDLGYSGTGVTVGVVDTGGTAPGSVQHPDLQFIGGYKFDGERGADFTAQNDHGMHVGGTIAADGAVFRGVAPDANLVAARAIGSNGKGAVSDVFDAIWWAAGGSLPDVPDNPNPARIINVSLGVDRRACPAAAASLFELLEQSGVIVVVAAGNSGIPADQVMPANCPGVITVGALEPGATQAPYSGFGPAVDIFAPGGLKTTEAEKKVFSTLVPVPGDSSPYGWEVGTSMAAPHVAGIIALMLEKNPTLSPAEVRAILQNSAYEPASCNECGAGAADARAALEATPESAGAPSFPPLPARPNAYFPAFVVALKTCKIGSASCMPISPQYGHGVDASASHFTQVTQFSNSEPFVIPGVPAGDYQVIAWRPFRMTTATSSGVPINAITGDGMALAPYLTLVGDNRESHVNLVLGSYQQGSIDAMLVHTMTQVLSDGL